MTQYTLLELETSVRSQRLYNCVFSKTSLSLALFLSIVLMLLLLSSSHGLLFNMRTGDTAKHMSSREVHYENFGNISFLIFHWNHELLFLSKKDNMPSLNMVSGQCLANGRSHRYNLGWPSLDNAEGKKGQYLTMIIFFLIWYKAPIEGNFLCTFMPPEDSHKWVWAKMLHI